MVFNRREVHAIFPSHGK